MMTQKTPVDPFTEWKLTMAKGAQDLDLFLSRSEPMALAINVETISELHGFAEVMGPFTLVEALTFISRFGAEDSAMGPRLMIEVA